MSTQHTPHINWDQVAAAQRLLDSPTDIDRVRDAHQLLTSALGLAVNNHERLMEAARVGAKGLREVIAYLRRDGSYVGLAVDRLKVLEAVTIP